MDPSTLKYYHVDEFESKPFLNTYFSLEGDKELLNDGLVNFTTYLHKEFAKGNIKRDMLIEISPGPVIFTLLPVCNYFKEIILLKFNDHSINEMKKWINGNAAFDWSHASKIIKDLEGNCDELQEKEDVLRTNIKDVLKCDLSKENLTDPIILPKADCIITAWVLEMVSKDKDAYCNNLRKIYSLLKPGGHLVMICDINVSFLKIGEHNFHILTYDEEFPKKTLKDLGFKIESYEVYEKTSSTTDIDYEKVMCLTALKKF
ncbi:indolethylamine N-methyltransferase-like [Pelobates fuscus]|uniref:indolethylamine N-methyltransferase-like n=1 Tax=Pelobates fuscus TaxID=191477 RepID=UPI002FE49035